MNTLTVRATLPDLRSLQDTKVTGVRVLDAWEYHLDFERDHTLVLGLSPEHNTLYCCTDADKEARLTKVPRLASAMWDHLMGARLASVHQAGLDRVVTFCFQRRDRLGDPARNQLVAELTGKGSNLVLLSGEVPFQGRLVERLRSDRSRQGGRRLSYGVNYVLPESGKADATETTPTALIHRLELELSAEETGEGDLRQAMCRAWQGLGPETAWEIQGRAHSSQPADLAEAWLRFLADTEPGGACFEPLTLTGPKGRKRVSVYRPQEPPENVTLESMPSVMEAIQQAHAVFKESKQKRPNGVLGQNLRRAIRRVENTLSAISKETDALSKDPGLLRRMGDTLLAHVHTVAKGSKEATLDDAETGEPLQIKLNPKLSPADNAALFFKKARKAERASETVSGRIQDLEERLERLRGMEEELQKLGDHPPGTDFLERIHALGVSLPREASEQLKDETMGMAANLRPRKYALGNGWEVLVGKSNKGNHVLTFELAKSHDTWMHAAQCPGSHVVLRHEEKGKEPPRDVLLTAAGIAAFFSKARNSTKVPVTVTEKRFVRRPRKAPVGQALVGEHKTVMVVPINPEGKS